MCLFEDMTRAVTTRYNDRIKKFCAPLFECFPINFFGYCQIKYSGAYTYAGSDIFWSEYFASEKLYKEFPYYRDPKFLRVGVYPLGMVNNLPLNEILDQARAFQNYSGLFVVDKISDGFECSCFFANSPTISQTLLLNELPFLRLFIKKFKEDSYLFSKLIDNQISLPTLMGPTFYERNLLQDPKLVKRNEFLEKLGVKHHFSLSSRETEIMGHLWRNSASNIAKKLNLSHRTIEHHIERIKDKMDCSSKSELIMKGRELEKLGYFGKSAFTLS